MNYKHGYSGERLYTIYQNMIKRCTKDYQHNYNLYGGRGVSVCKEWSDDYIEFRKWALDSGYSEDLSLDRKDCDGNYEPSNCRWATIKEQSSNKRSNRNHTYKGETMNRTEFARKYNIQYETLRGRLNSGWTIDDAIEVPIKRRKKRK